MSISEQDLPGIGRRYDLPLEAGRRLTIIVHHSGRRDLYFFERSAESPAWALELTDDQARRIGAILGGAFFKPAVVEQIESIVGEFVVDWIALTAGDRAVGKSITELQIRRQTGMSVVAIVRGKKTLTAPDPDEVLEIGDRLVVVGRHNDLPRFLEYVSG
jgi:TrkA domain protein